MKECGVKILFQLVNYLIKMDLVTKTINLPLSFKEKFHLWNSSSTKKCFKLLFSNQ